MKSGGDSKDICNRIDRIARISSLESYFGHGACLSPDRAILCGDPLAAWRLDFVESEVKVWQDVIVP